jgi:hypothetical protein
MVASETELPNWIASRIDKPDGNKSLTQYQVAKQFVDSDRPYYNVSRMHAALDGDTHSDTVKARMNELVNKDVLKSEQVNSGNVYWVNHDDSSWPIPPDVEVQPKRTEPTVSEWKKYEYVRVAAFSLFLAVVGTAVTLIGTFQAGGYYSTPFLTENIIAIGLSSGVMSYFGLFISGLLWVFDIDELPEL